MQIADSDYHQLVAWVVRYAAAAPDPDRIKVYNLLAKVAPTEFQREKAAKVALSLSAAAAAQLELGDMFRPGLSGDGKGDGQ